MMILVGSKALAKHLPGLVTPRDTDFFATTAKEAGGTEVFFHPDLDKWKWSCEVASLDELYTIKVSHIFWDLRNGSWGKHIEHTMLMKNQGAQFLPKLYDVLYPIWEQQYGAKMANLNQEPEHFFNKRVKRVFEHDSIHRAIAYGERPLFELILKEGSQVMVSQEKFESLEHKDKLKLVREEVYATALERQVIPGFMSPRDAYRWALKMLITSFSKGWFPLWVVLHVDELLEPDCDYVARMHANCNKLVVLHKEE